MNATILEDYRLYTEEKEGKMIKSKNDDILLLCLFGLLGAWFLGTFLLAVINIVWKSYKSKRVGPLTKAPIIPFSLDDLTWIHHPIGIKFLCESHASVRISYTELIMASLWGPLKIEFRDDFPRYARVISIKMNGFDFGSECQTFEPIDGIGPESYYTYQMFGDNQLQVTNYVENEVSYVAGFVIYIPDGYTQVCFYPFEIINQFIESPKYKCTRPIIRKKEEEVVQLVGITKITENEEVRVEKETTALLEEADIEDWSVKRCGKLQRAVMTTVRDESAYHQEWIPILQKMKVHKCTECSETFHQDLHPPRYSSLSMV